ncbi:uncharacterized protein LOC110465562 [Mizuhopecten yessoensis]|uniref:uncharacterized protein LOC110440785 n=1 Tax=Mizuhopecten yessoensis TaxID=6573 RepID=UPI000B4577F6|nr:uncharacterized protein LOC110440785 [Mizuhopecten yessoensis]XP_021377158.1 uncharacterized protein LOC110465562 [Mizuhopecten yessoensis]
MSEILSKAAKTSTIGAPSHRHKANGLTVWNENIASSIRNSRRCHWEWKLNGRPSDPAKPLLIARKFAKHELKKHIRIASAQKLMHDRDEIMEARLNDSGRLYKLIDKHRGKLRGCISELKVGEHTYNGQEVLLGLNQHFGSLGRPTDIPLFDEKYAELVETDVDTISDICRSNTADVTFSREAVAKAILSLNKNKTEYIYDLATEHLQYAGKRVLNVVTWIVNSIMKAGFVPPAMKKGTIVPVFKNKGSKFEAKNYRGITVTPVVTKVPEALLLPSIRPLVAEIQNHLQRGFTN